MGTASSCPGLKQGEKEDEDGLKCIGVRALLQTCSHRWVLDTCVGAAPFPGCLQGSEQGLSCPGSQTLSFTNSHPLASVSAGSSFLYFRYEWL